MTHWSQVPHDFTEGYQDYTQMLSRWPDSPIAWRQPFNLAWSLLLDSQDSHQVTLNSEVERQRPLEQRLPSCDPAANPDVAAAEMNAYAHLICHGLPEGRSWGLTMDLEQQP